MSDSDPIELVIFDCDGVLVDSEKLSVEIDRRVLAELGWALSREEIVHRFVGRTMSEQASPRLISSCTPQIDSASRPRAARSSKTADSASKRRGRQA